MSLEEDSQNISSSGAYATEEFVPSSSSTGYKSLDFESRLAQHPPVPDPKPVNQVPGQVFVDREDLVNKESGPHDPDNESLVECKIALNKARKNLLEGYILEYDENSPNIVEPQRENRICFHIVSLEGGIVFPLRPLVLGELGPDVADCLSKGSPSRATRLEEKVKEGEKRARELNAVILWQTDELAKVSKAAGVVGAENLQLKEENTQPMEEVSVGLMGDHRSPLSFATVLVTVLGIDSPT
ncbi:unnamed protein product [Cuscuta campestris]|uniref:Uncharacterized protein n=1 Tax=Cuscuta campestris TaxID=132261 RepID=A0A484LN88_9ASTE|nr:unnamed protein product [Cuscuta campestris]